MKRILVLSLLVSVIVILGCSRQQVNKNSLSSLVSQSKISSQTSIVVPANWKTYVNNEYGYEISYPENWKMAEGLGSVDFFPGEMGSPTVKEGDFNFELNIYKNVSPSGDTYQIAQQNWLGWSNNELCSNTTIASIDWFRCVLEGPSDGCSDTNNIQYHLKRGDVYYDAVTMYRCNGKDNGIGDKIMATLKFTK